MFKFPWGDFHSLNLGWFLQKFNELLQDWATAEAGIDGALDAEIQKAEDALTDVFAARDAAAASATQAGNSATAAAGSATAAGGSATAAGNSATAARNSATAASQSETAAAQSATAASNSATAAATSATQAGNSATAAQNSASAAAESEQNVERIIEDATSEAIASATQTATTAATNAANSATAAGNSATAAAGSATAAGNSATAAAGSATAAAGSATQAGNSAAAAAASEARIETAIATEVNIKNPLIRFPDNQYEITRRDGIVIQEVQNKIDQLSTNARNLVLTNSSLRIVSDLNESNITIDDCSPITTPGRSLLCVLIYNIEDPSRTDPTDILDVLYVITWNPQTGQFTTARRTLNIFNTSLGVIATFPIDQLTETNKLAISLYFRRNDPDHKITLKIWLEPLETTVGMQSISPVFDGSKELTGSEISEDELIAKE